MYEDPNLNLGVAASLMGKSEQFVRIGLQQGVLPFGVAVKNKTRSITSARKGSVPSLESLIRNMRKG